jgi:hypothetical protein
VHLSANVLDISTFRRRGASVEFLLLYTSVEKATRYFNGGRFWQIPSNVMADGESIVEAITRVPLESQRGLRWVREDVTGVEERCS